MDVDKSVHHKGNLKGHTAMINSISICTPNNTLLSTSDDKTCRLWDIETFNCLRKMEIPIRSTIKCCQFVDHNSFVTAGDDGAVSLWDSRTGHVVVQITKHKGSATTVSVSDGGKKIISGGWDNMMFVSDLRRNISQKLGGHTDWILTTSVSRNGSVIASAGWDSDILLWKPSVNDYVFTKLTAHMDAVTSIDISPDSRFLASGSYDSTIKLWKTDSHAIVKSYAGHKGRVNCVTFTKQENLLISAGNDMAVKLWDVNTGNLRGEFFCQGPATAVNSDVVGGELQMIFGDSIGNLYLSKLHSSRLGDSF
jgi:WD40 repeat protein